MSEQPVERGPNYDWQHEVRHYQEECDKLRELLGSYDRAAEARTRELEAALSVATEAFEDIKFHSCEPFRGSKWRDHIHSISKEALSDPTIQKEAERIRAMEEVILQARTLRSAQKSYMADRGNEAKGKIVGQMAEVLDSKLHRLDEREG